MSKVQIIDPSEQEQMAAAAAADHSRSRATNSPLTTLHEHIGHENYTSRVSIVNTVEAMQMAVEEFSEHVETCNVSFKQAIFEKVKQLKKNDTETLTERVSPRPSSGHHTPATTPSNILTAFLLRSGGGIEGTGELRAEQTQPSLP